MLFEIRRREKNLSSRNSYGLPKKYYILSIKTVLIVSTRLEFKRPENYEKLLKKKKFYFRIIGYVNRILNLSNALCHTALKSGPLPNPTRFRNNPIIIIFEYFYTIDIFKYKPE